MKKYILLPLVAVVFCLFSCSNDDDNTTASNRIPTPQIGLEAEANTVIKNQINSFIYRSLNAFYLYKDEQPLLENSKFSNDQEFTEFIESQGEPRAFFDLLKTVPSNDRFSFITNDFVRLENFFQGVRLSTGMEFISMDIPGENSKYIAVTQVVKDSPADIAGVKRGMIFNKIDGEDITDTTDNKLFGSSPTNFTLGLANVIDGDIRDTDQTFDLEKVEFTENPIAIAKTLEVEGAKIGYLLYNGFIRNSEEALNVEFGKFKSEGISDLIVDLRYNGGGSVATAIALASLITGQFTDQVVLKEQWNSEVQEIFTRNNPDRLVDNFIDKTPANVALNSLNLNKVYFITTKEQTASSSELVPNSLSAYIDVVIIGDETGTVGKSQASTTFYDSPTLFSKENVNSNHKYAMQPLIFKSVNKDDVQVPNSGLTPTIIAKENLFDLGTLGDTNETLLQAAINDIVGGTNLAAKQLKSKSYGTYSGSSRMYDPTYQRMYINPN